MGRFDLNDGDKGLNYKEALEFLGEVRAGISYNRFTALSIRYFDLFMNILNDTGDSRKYLENNHLDRIFITDMIKQVLHRLHFNRENDHYLTLGLPRNASEEDIHRRWRDLIIIYHPDRNLNDRTASECAKRINEAYSILKDPDRRALYDRKLLGSTIIPKGPVKKKEGNRKVHYGMTLSPESRRIISRIVKVSLFLFPVAIITMVFIDQRSQVFDLYNYSRTGDMDNVKMARPENGDEQIQEDKAGKTVVNREANEKGYKHISGDEKKTPSPGSKEGRTPGTLSPAPSVDYSGITNETEHGAYREPVDLRKPSETSLALAGAANIADGAETVKKEKKDTGAIQDDKTDLSSKNAGGIPEEVHAQKSNMGNTSKKEEISQLNRPVTLTEKINTFLMAYRQAYNRGDHKEFMSLYSINAIENGMTYDEIKRLYREYFRGDRYNSIEINNIQIIERSDGIIVFGRYRLYKLKGGSILSSEEGNVKWTLARDGNYLRIIRSEYDRD